MCLLFCNCSNNNLIFTSTSGSVTSLNLVYTIVYCSSARRFTKCINLIVFVSLRNGKNCVGIRLNVVCIVAELIYLKCTNLKLKFNKVVAR